MEARRFISLLDETERALWRMPLLMEKLGSVDDLIPRHQMPAIRAKLIPKFVRWLRKQGVSVERVDVPAADLRPTQTEVDPDKVRKILRTGGNDKFILISKDNRVLDGHHHWAAAWLRGFRSPCRCLQADRTIKQLMKLAHDFPHVQYKEFGE